MDKLAKYQNCIQELLTRYANEDKGNAEVEVQLIFDVERGHFQWMNVGWEGFDRIYRCAVHLDLRDGKVWLQQNLTDQNPAAELMEMGVAREDIILGLQPPYKRPYTEYGVA